jgi:hypothetical protein
MGLDASSVAEDALEDVRTELGRAIDLQRPPLVLEYEIAADLIRRVIHAAARVVPADAPDPIAFMISNVEVDLGENDYSPSAIRAGKHLGITFRWPTTGVIPEVPQALQVLLSASGSYAYAVDRDGEGSITVLLRDLGMD